MVRDQFSRLLGLKGTKPDHKNITMVPVDQIEMNPYQPRQDFDPEAIEQLSQSIREHGVLQPVILREKNDHFELVAGERRLRASKKLGLDSIPGIIKVLSDKELAELALIENLQRRDLNFMEEARGYSQLLQEFNLTQQELAERVGKSQSTIANKLRILKLPSRVKDRLQAKEITERHARALLRLDSSDEQHEVLDQVVERELTVRQTEDLIDRMQKDQTSKGQKQKKSSITGAYKDVRLFQNAIHNTISEIEKAGLDVDVDEIDQRDYIEIKIRLPKNTEE